MKEIEKSFMIKCPQCEEDFSYYTSKSRPFCSEKCQLLDLGGWLREDYRVAGRAAIIEDSQGEGENEE